MPAVRHILLLMLSRNERKRAVLKQDDGWLYVEPVPEDNGRDQAPVVRIRQIDEKTLGMIIEEEVDRIKAKKATSG